MKQIFKQPYWYDTALVWHCEIRHTDVCKLNHRCFGTGCKFYKLTDGSVAIENNYLKSNKKEEK